MAADRWACAYVDIDQLGICYPELRSDPGRYRLKERNLSAVAANFADDEAAWRGGVGCRAAPPVARISLSWRT